jgi:hypothetical protein
MFTSTEVKPGLAVIKLEPKAEIYLEPDGITDPEPDDEKDTLAFNIERDGSVVEHEDLPCFLAFLEVEIKAEDDILENAAETMKVGMNGVTRDEQQGDHLEGLNGVAKMTWNGHVELNSERRKPKKHVNMSEEEKMAEQRVRDRQCRSRYPAYRSEEAIARERERNRLNMRKIRASLKN